MKRIFAALHVKHVHHKPPGFDILWKDNIQEKRK